MNIIAHAPNQLATIYLRSEFFGNIVKHEVKLVELCEGVQYAQYNNATRVKFIPKGKRNVRGATLTYKPWILVVAGHGHPEPKDMYGEAVPSGVPGVSMYKSEYSSFDDRFMSDFEAGVLPKIDADKIIYKRFK